MGSQAQNVIRLFFAGNFFKEVSMWYKDDGIIYLKVTSDGTAGEEWIGRLEANDFRLKEEAKKVIKTIIPTSGVTYKIAIVLWSLDMLNIPTIHAVRKFGASHEFKAPSVEVACLVRELLTDKDIKEMAESYLIFMHEAVSGSLLRAHCLGAGRFLDAVSAQAQPLLGGYVFCR